MKISQFNPCSPQYHAIDTFKSLSACNKIITVVLSALAGLISIPLAGLFGVAVFRELTKKFSKDLNTLPQQQTAQKVNDTAKIAEAKLAEVQKSDAGAPGAKPKFYQTQLNEAREDIKVIKEFLANREAVQNPVIADPNLMDEVANKDEVVRQEGSDKQEILDGHASEQADDDQEILDGQAEEDAARKKAEEEAVIAEQEAKRHTEEAEIRRKAEEEAAKVEHEARIQAEKTAIAEQEAKRKEDERLAKEEARKQAIEKAKADRETANAKKVEQINADVVSGDLTKDTLNELSTFFKSMKSLFTKEHFQILVSNCPELKIDINRTEDYLICHAARYGNLEALEILVKAGVNVNKVYPDKNIKTVLKIALESSKFDVVTWLLQNGANKVDASLLKLDYEKVKPKLEVLISACDNLKSLYLTIKGKFADTKEPIMLIAARDGNIAAIEALIKAGLDVNQNWGLRNALNTAFAYLEFDTITWLLQNGAKKIDAADIRLASENEFSLVSNSQKIQSFVTRKGVCGISEDEFKLLLSSCNNLEDLKLDASNYYRYVPLMLVAVEAANVKIVEMLIEAGADINKACYPQSNTTALSTAQFNHDKALYSGKTNMVDWLKSKGATK